MYDSHKAVLEMTKKDSTTGYRGEQTVLELIWHIPVLKFFKPSLSLGIFHIYILSQSPSLNYYVVWPFPQVPGSWNPWDTLKNQMPIVFLQKTNHVPNHVQSLFLYTLKELCHGHAHLQKNPWNVICYYPVMVQIYYSNINGAPYSPVSHGILPKEKKSNSDFDFSSIQKDSLKKKNSPHHILKFLSQFSAPQLSG